MLTRHLGITFFMVWVLIVANLVGVALSFAFLNQLAKITFIRGTLLVPFILVLVFLGSLVPSGQIGDVAVTLLFGTLAWLMHRLRWPITPMLLGFVLGDRAENNLWISSRIYGFTWLGRPLVLVLMMAALATIAFTVIRLLRASIADAERNHEPFPLGQVVFSGVAAGIACAAALAAQEWPSSARLFPTVIGLPMAACGVLQFVKALRAPGWRAQPASQRAEVHQGPVQSGGKRTSEIFGWLVGVFLAVWGLGFSMVVAPFIFLYLKFVSRESWQVSLGLATLTALIQYGLLETLLRVSTPAGALFR
jgi:hypothetical protein